MLYIDENIIYLIGDYSCQRPVNQKQNYTVMRMKLIRILDVVGEAAVVVITRGRGRPKKERPPKENTSQ